MITYISPTIIKLDGYEDKIDELESFLSYTNKAVLYQVKRFKENIWFINKHGEEKWREQLEELENKAYCCLLKDTNEGLFTYSGLAHQLSSRFNDLNIINNINYKLPTNNIPWLSPPTYNLREYQKDSIIKLIAHKHGAVSMPTGCHRKGEKVLKYDGKLVKVEDIKVGDLLMGPDSKPRKVLELKYGFDTMYEVETINGQKMYVNGNHVLSLQSTNVRKKPKFKCQEGLKITNITVNDYLNTSKYFKHLNKIYTTGVEFQEQNLPLDPYFMGLLLGDGSVIDSVNLTSMDSEIIDFANKYITSKFKELHIRERKKDNNKASTFHYSVPRIGNTRGKNSLIFILRSLGLTSCDSEFKFIPNKYLINSRKNRLQLLAGLIDTDGSLGNNIFDYITKSKILAEDVCFLSRSLGLRATLSECYKSCQTGAVGKYYRICISGFIDEIPTLLKRKQASSRKQIKSPNRFGFTVTKVADDEEYFGFTLDGDHLYLTDGFIVTHNSGKSPIILHVTKELGQKTVIMSPSIPISEQLYNDFVAKLGKRYVGFFGNTKRHCDRLITIAVAQSLTRVQPDSKEWSELSQSKVFIADESHTTPTETLQKVCTGLLANVPYRFFFSATQMRNDGSDLLLDAIIGPIVHQETLQSLVDKGFLAKPNFLILRSYSPSEYVTKNVLNMMNKHIYTNTVLHKQMGELATQLANNMNHQVLIAIDHIEQFKYLKPYLPNNIGFAHGGVTKKNQKFVPPEYHDLDTSEEVKRFNNKEVKILVGTSTVTTGVDMPSINTICNLMAGKSEIKFSQLNGRGTRLSPGKTEFNFVDYDILNIPMLHNHTKERVKIYKSLYDNIKYL